MDVTLQKPEEIGALCRKLREEAGLSQQEVAEAIGAKRRQDVWNAEHATGTERLGLQERILQHFGKRLEMLFHVADA